MNKRSLLVVGLLLSMNGIFADKVGSAADLEAVKPEVNHDYVDEAAHKYAESIVSQILSGNESKISSAFCSIPEQLAGDREKIYRYVLEDLSERANSEQRKVYAPAIAKKALVESHKNEILSPEPVLSKWDQGKAWAWDNREALKNIAIVGLGAAVLVMACASEKEIPTSSDIITGLGDFLTKGDTSMQNTILAEVGSTKQAVDLLTDDNGKLIEALKKALQEAIAANKGDSK